MRKKGFTLVEMIAVIAVLGILVLLVVPNVLRLYRDSRKNAFIDEAKNIYTQASNSYVLGKTSGKRIEYITNVIGEEQNELSIKNKKDLTYQIMLNKKGKIDEFLLKNSEFCIVGEGNFLDNYSKEDVIELDSDMEGTCKISGPVLVVAEEEVENGNYTIEYDLNGGSFGAQHPNIATFNKEVEISNPIKKIILHFDEGDTGAVIENNIRTLEKNYDFAGWSSKNVNIGGAKFGDKNSIDNEWSSNDLIVNATNFINLADSNTKKVNLFANYEKISLRLPTITKENYVCKWTSDTYTWESGGVYSTASVVGATERTFVAKCSKNPDPVPENLPDTLFCGIKLKYTGKFVIKDGFNKEKTYVNTTATINECSWYIKFLTTGTLTILSDNPPRIDAFLVAGGAAGGGYAGSGGAGGEVKTAKNIIISSNEKYKITIGASSQNTTAFNATARTGRGLSGGAGCSAGYDFCPDIGDYGGYSWCTRGGKSNKTAFNDLYVDDTKYGSGGDGGSLCLCMTCCGAGCVHINGEPNTGNGGAGGGYSGGSGIVIIRNNNSSSITSNNSLHEWTYGAKTGTTLTCNYNGYDKNSMELRYIFGYSNSLNVEPTNWNEKNLSTSKSLMIPANAFSGNRYYSCRVYKKVNGKYELLSKSISGYHVKINNVKLIFNRGNSKATINDKNINSITYYSRKGSTKIYNGINSEEEASFPTVYLKGYELDGWYTKASGGDKIITNNNVINPRSVSGYTSIISNKGVFNLTANKTLYAHYQPTKYKIKYNLDGGKFNQTVKEEYTISSSKYTLITPVKEGYMFVGWTGTDVNGQLMTVTIPANATGDRTYTAHWKANTYNLFIKKDDTTTAEVRNNVNFVDTVKIDNPKKDGYTFIGWTAKSGLNVKTALYGSNTDPINWTNWSNVNLKLRNIYYSRLGNTNAAVNLVGNWISGNVDYLITYNLNGATNISTAPTYGIANTAINISNPIRTGYTFTGWEGNELGEEAKTGTSVAAVKNVKTQIWDGSLTKNAYFINLGKEGRDVNLEANWSANPYKIQLNSNVASGTSPATFGDTTPELEKNNIINTKYDEVVTIKNPSRVGYTFQGWTGQSNLDVAQAHYGNDSENPGALWDNKNTNVIDIYFKNLTTVTNRQVVLKANWKTHKYNVAYDFLADEDLDDLTERNLNVSIVSLVDTAQYDKEFVVNNPTRTGYTFLGWEIKNYNPSTAQYHNGKTFVAYKGERIKNTRFKNLTPIDDGEVIFEAYWKKNTYKITINPNGGIYNKISKAQTLENNEYDSVITLQEPTRDHYNFMGWTSSNINVNTSVFRETIDGYSNPWTLGSIKVRANYFKNLIPTQGGTVTLVANWSLVDYEIEYELNGGTFTTNDENIYKYQFTAAKKLPTAVSREHYTFGGWYDNPEFNGSNITQINKNQSGTKKFYAKWNSFQYTIAIQPNGGSYNGSTKNQSVKIEYNDSTYIPNPTKANNVFLGWKATGGLSTSTALYGTNETNVDNSWTDTTEFVSATYFKKLSVKNNATVTLQAQWLKSDQYALKYHNGSCNVTKVYAQTTQVKPSDFTRTGYKMTELGIKNNLSSNAQKYNASTKKWEVYDGSKLDISKYTAFKSLGTLGKVSDLDITWIPITYKINIKPNGGLYNDSQSNQLLSDIKYDEVVQIENPVRAGYIFQGWSVISNLNTVTAKSGTTDTPNTAITSSSVRIKDTYFKNLAAASGKEVVLQAYWAEEDYNINLFCNCDTNVESLIYRIPRNTTLPKPTKIGYVFDGWYDNPEFTGEKYTAYGLGKTGDVNLYAKWIPNPYKVKLFSNAKSGTPATLGKTTPSIDSTDTLTTVYDEVITIEKPTRVGYNFTGWKPSNLNTKTALYGATDTPETLWSDVNNLVGDKYFKNLSPTKNAVVSLTAQYEAHSYHITYELDGGSIVTNGSQPSIGVYDTPFYVTTPTKSGYKFLGWTISGDVSSNAKYGGNTKVVEAWTNPKNYAYGVAQYTYFSNLSEIIDGEITLIANWQPNTYTITFNAACSGCSITSNKNLQEIGTTTITVTYDSIASAINIPKALDQNKTFLGYYSGKLGSGRQYYDSSGNGILYENANNITLYALFD